MLENKVDRNKVMDIMFIVVFLIMITLPLLTTDFSDQAISETENRILADKPRLYRDGVLNVSFISELETWFEDHVGFRSVFVLANANMQYYIFGQLTNTGDRYLGPNGELNYASDEMIYDYAHVNLKTDEELDEIAESYQIYSDYLKARGVQY